MVTVGKAAIGDVGYGPIAFVTRGHGQGLIGWLALLVFHGGQPLVAVVANDLCPTIVGIDSLLIIPPDIGRTSTDSLRLPHLGQLYMDLSLFIVCGAGASRPKCYAFARLTD